MRERHSIIDGSHTRIAASLYLAVFLVMIAFLVRYNAPTPSYQSAYNAAPDAARYFDDLRLEAKAVYVFDSMSRKVLWQKNAELPLPLASVTKIMTAVCALNNLDKEGYITIPISRLKEYGDANIIPGNRIKVRDLVSYTLVKSSNDGAAALADMLGGSEQMVQCMNTRAEQMGLFDTQFYNETGLDIDDKPGAYGSARDAATLLLTAYGMYPDIFGATRYESYTLGEGALSGTNTNKAQSMIIGMQSGKTGLTDLAGGNLVFSMNVGLGHTVAIAILGSGENGRFQDALLLSQAVIDYLGETR